MVAYGPFPCAAAAAFKATYGRIRPLPSAACKTTYGAPNLGGRRDWRHGLSLKFLFSTNFIAKDHSYFRIR